MSHERLQALHLAGFRRTIARKGLSHCRICQGQAWAGKPYCPRHFKCLEGYADLAAKAKAGVNLDTIDAVIRLRTTFPKMHFSAGAIIVDGITLRVDSRGGWVAKVIDGPQERELDRFASLLDAYTWIAHRLQASSSHNRWATKTLIT